MESDFERTNYYIFESHEYRIKLNELTREHFPPQYAYMLATPLEETSSEPTAEPVENQETNYRTVSIEEAMELWKDKNPVFAKLVEQFNEE